MAELQGLGAKLSEVEQVRRGDRRYFTRSLGLGYRFVADRDLAVTQRYGLVHTGAGPAGHDVPRPAMVVLDRDGIVRWFSVSRNVQVRPDPRDVLRAVHAL